MVERVSEINYASVSCFSQPLFPFRQRVQLLPQGCAVFLSAPVCMSSLLASVPVGMGCSPNAFPCQNGNRWQPVWVSG